MVSAQAIIEFQETIHDFGILKEGEMATNTFLVKNTGDKPLVIAEVKPSCGCTTPYFSKRPIPPGKTDSIVVAYNTKGRPGQFNKSVQVISNADPSRNTIYIRGAVIKPIPKNNSVLTLERKTIELGHVKPSKDLYITVQATNSGTEALNIGAAYSECSCVFLQDKLNVQPGEVAGISLRIRPKDGQKGSFETSFISSAKNRDKAILTIVFDAAIPPDTKEIIQKKPNAFDW
jgi:hypothetical protein